MKTFLILFATIVSCALGYWAEPRLRTHVSAPPAAKTPNPAATTTAGVATIVETPASNNGGLLPEKVTLNKKVQFADQSSGLTMTIDAGSEVRLIRIDGDNAIVRIGETDYTIIVPIAHTDLHARLGKTEPDPIKPVLVPEVAPEPAPEPPPVPEPAPETAPAPAPEPAPEVETNPEPAPQPEPAPAPEPAPTPTPPANGKVDVVGVMRESIRNGEIKEFEFTQVQDWKASEDETIDGQVYQTGLVSYEAETIFGAKTIQAKALIQNGKVMRWIWPKSGVQIQ